MRSTVFLFHIYTNVLYDVNEVKLTGYFAKNVLYHIFMTCIIKSLTSGVLHTEDSYNGVNKTTGLWGGGKGKAFCFVFLLFLRVP